MEPTIKTKNRASRKPCRQKNTKKKISGKPINARTMTTPDPRPMRRNATSRLVILNSSKIRLLELTHPEPPALLDSNPITPVYSMPDARIPASVGL
jgi:hypothetical protein